MNKTVIALGIACVTLAASTAYLALQVQKERRLAGQELAARPADAHAPTGRAPEAGSHRESAANGSQGTSGSANSSESASNSAWSGGRPSRDVVQRSYDEIVVRLFNDPQGHRELIEEQIPPLRDKYLPLQRRLEVDDQQWLRFLEMVAERQLGYAAARADCKATNTCNRARPSAESVAEDRMRVAEVLGEARAAEVYRFEQSDIERRSINTVQEEAPEHQRLTEERSEELVMALHQLRQDTASRMYAAQTPMGSFFGKGGMLLYDMSLPTSEARVEAASNYSKLLREQASKYLSGRMLDNYNRLQDEMLEQMRAVKP